MPFLFLTFGFLFLVAGARGTQTQLLSLLKGDLLGKPNFIVWFVSIMAIGALGYIPDLRPVSRAFLALVIIVLVIESEKNSQLFEKITQALNSTEKAGSSSANSSTAQSSTTSQSPSSSSSNPLSSLSDAFDGGDIL